MSYFSPWILDIVIAGLTKMHWCSALLCWVFSYCQLSNLLLCPCVAPLCIFSLRLHNFVEDHKKCFSSKSSCPHWCLIQSDALEIKNIFLKMYQPCIACVMHLGLGDRILLNGSKQNDIEHSIWSPFCLRMVTSWSSEPRSHTLYIISMQSASHKNTWTKTDTGRKTVRNHPASNLFLKLSKWVFRHHKHSREEWANREAAPVWPHKEWDDFDIPWAHDTRYSD